MNVKVIVTFLLVGATASGLHAQNPDFDITTCMVNPENTKSLLLARKIGYFEVGRANLREEPLVLMNRSRYAGLAGAAR